jgi:hypothetical protein
VSENAAEDGRVGESPAGADVVDGKGAQGGVGEVATGVFQALVADPSGDCDAFGLEQAVQVTDRDVMSGGDSARGQVRFVQVLLDERPDAQGQGPTVSLWCESIFGVERMSEQSRQQIDQDRPQSGPSPSCPGTRG